MKEITHSWNYNDSVSKVKSAVYKWKNLTIGIMGELSRAHEKLAKRRVGKNDVVNTTSKTWAGYCKDVGIHRDTVHRWLKHYNTLLEQGTLEVGADTEMKLLSAPKKQREEKNKRERELEGALEEAKDIIKSKRKEAIVLEDRISDYEKQLEDYFKLEDVKAEVRAIRGKIVQLEASQAEVLVLADGVEEIYRALLRSRTFFGKELSLLPTVKPCNDSKKLMSGNVNELLSIVDNWVLAIKQNLL